MSPYTNTHFSFLTQTNYLLKTSSASKYGCNFCEVFHLYLYVISNALRQLYLQNKKNMAMCTFY